MTNSLQPQFLSADDNPVYRIRCPIHGFIRFSKNERNIIDHRLFRRLRWIRQLAMTELVYPGATHTRFEHSLGVMEVATRMFDNLALRHGERMESIFRTVEHLKDKTMAKARQIVRLGALLHDLGHCCFSHAAEHVIHKERKHEALTCEILKTPAMLGQTIDSAFFSDCAALVAQLVEPGANFPPQLQVLRNIVSGQVDADRTDYLLRDAHHCGVDYGRFDHRRTIECLTLREDDDGMGGLDMAVTKDGVHALEALILARYQMNTQVYYHRIRRIYDLYLQEYFKEKGQGLFDTADKVLAHNDITATKMIMDDAENSGAPGHQWALRIRDRRHHREVYYSGDHADAMAIGRAHRGFLKIQQTYTDIDFRWETPDKPVKIHTLLRRGDHDASKTDEFYVIDSDGTAAYLSERSSVLATIPKNFLFARIFASIPQDDDSRRREIARACKEQCQ